jgi:hypothetical protein
MFVKPPWLNLGFDKSPCHKTDYFRGPVKKTYLTRRPSMPVLINVCRGFVLEKNPNSGAADFLAVVPQSTMRKASAFAPPRGATARLMNVMSCEFDNAEHGKAMFDLYHVLRRLAWLAGPLFRAFLKLIKGNSR